MLSEVHSDEHPPSTPLQISQDCDDSSERTEHSTWDLRRLQLWRGAVLGGKWRAAV